MKYKGRPASAVGISIRFKKEIQQELFVPLFTQKVLYSRTIDSYSTVPHSKSTDLIKRYKKWQLAKKNISSTIHDRIVF